MAVVSPVLTVAAVVIWSRLPAEWIPARTVSPQSAAGLTFPAVGAFCSSTAPG